MTHVKDTYYFSHDSNARNDEKILMLRAEHGWQGYGLYWALIEMMFENQDTCLNHSKVKGIAAGLGMSIVTLEEVINTCIAERLFESDGDYFWSSSLRKRKEKIKEIREVRAEAGQKGGNIRAQRMREAKKKGTHTEAEWKEMLDFFEYKCVACGCEVEGVPCKDHIIPIYKGGSDSITNIQPLCRGCNSSKSQDETDQRLSYCQANAKQMPSKWLAKCSKESKVKESKESKESKGSNTTSKNFPEESTEMQLAFTLKSLILCNNPNARVPDSLQKWAKSFDLMLRVDNRTPDEIAAVMQFSQEDDFWMQNILSAGKLREKYDQLYMKMNKNRSGKEPKSWRTLKEWLEEGEHG